MVGKPKGTKDPKLAPAADGPEPSFVVTAIHIPIDLLTLLRQVAIQRAAVAGGRPSVSAVLVDLVRANADALQHEAKGS